ncbi:MAG: hypothetical protein IAE91_15630 [Ignavibacteriaceae bacterium]|nr:hypothetical protein [Ignavibacteriaceae bacterium]
MKKNILLLFLLLISSRYTTAQYFEDEFPRIGFGDFYYLKLFPPYYNYDSSRLDFSAQGYYYDKLEELGLTHIVTKAGDISYKYNKKLKILDFNFAWKSFNNKDYLAYAYARAQGNDFNYYPYELGGDPAPLSLKSGFGDSVHTNFWTSFSNNGFVNGNYSHPFVTGKKVFYAPGSQSKEFTVFNTRLNNYQQSNGRIDNSHIYSYKAAFNVYAENRELLNSRDTLFIVYISESPVTSTFSLSFFKDTELKNLKINGVTIHKFSFTADEFIPEKFSTLITPGFQKPGEFSTLLQLRIVSTGKTGLHFDKFAIYDNKYENLFLSTPAIQDSIREEIRSGMYAAFYEIAKNPLYEHPYFDEPWFNASRAFNTVSMIAAQENGIGEGKYLNGATGDYADYFLDYTNKNRYYPYVLYNRYPILCGTDSASEGENSLQIALQNLIKYTDANGLTRGLLPAYQITKDSAGVSLSRRFVHTIQVQAEYFVKNSMLSRCVYRAPTYNEILIQGNLALAYGATGIMYYTTFTGTHGANINQDLWAFYGLFDEQGNQFDAASKGIVQDPAQLQIPNNRYFAVKELNLFIEKNKSIFLNSEHLSVKSVNAATKLKFGNLEVANFRAGKEKNCVIDCFDNIESTFLEAAVFRNSNENCYYLFLVNRRCLESETRYVSFTITGGKPDSNIRISEIDSVTSFTVKENSSIEIEIKPGRGKFIKIEE